MYCWTSLMWRQCRSPHNSRIVSHLNVYIVDGEDDVADAAAGSSSGKSGKSATMTTTTEASSSPTSAKISTRGTTQQHSRASAGTMPEADQSSFLAAINGTVSSLCRPISLFFFSMSHQTLLSNGYTHREQVYYISIDEEEYFPWLLFFFLSYFSRRKVVLYVLFRYMFLAEITSLLSSNLVNKILWIPASNFLIQIKKKHLFCSYLISRKFYNSTIKRTRFLLVASFRILCSPYFFVHGSKKFI